MKKKWIKLGGLILVMTVFSVAISGCMGMRPGNTTNNKGNNAVATVNKPVEASDNSADPNTNQEVQQVTTKIGSNSYPPITVQKGIPVSWTITAQAADINGCNNEMIAKDFNIDLKLKAGDNVVTFTPEQTGTFRYSCWMGMIQSTITVVDNIEDVSAEPVVKDQSNENASVNPNGNLGDGNQTGVGCSMVNGVDQNQDNADAAPNRSGCCG